jgi:3-oxoacyl-[acyl-carrier protein] reductase
MTRAVVDARRDALVAQVPLHRLGKPEDVAMAIAFLASEAAGYITGTHLEITGGKLCVQNPELPWRNAARDGGA